MKGWGFEMNLKDQMNGIQHVGVPTNDIETTIKFYEALGFKIAFQTVNEAANEKVAFLKLGNLVIETYENKAAKMESGAIDHVAIDVRDVEKVHELVTAAGLNTTNDEVHFLPFWENGVKFFTIEGPNKEKVEFSQYLSEVNKIVFMSVKQSTIQRFVLCCIQPVRYKMIKDHRVSGGLFSVLDRIWGRGKISCMKWIMRLQ